MTAEATAHGAVTLLNATATGRGCSLAVQGGVVARWTWQDAPGLRWNAAVDDRLAQACMHWHQERGAPAGATAWTQSEAPPACGLKTSSSAAAALLQAAARDQGQELDAPGLEGAAVAVNRTAGTTLTGAYDDQVAVVRGGCHLTDNPRLHILAEIPVEPWAVAVWVPQAHIPKSALHGIDATVLRPEAEAVEHLLRQGRVPEAMTRNGAAYTRLYRAAGLPVTDAPTDAALAAGALGAGLSGTGPAVAALFDAPVDLPRVPGGAWVWTEAVP